MKEEKANLLKSDLEHVGKRIKIMLNTLELELNDDSFSELDLHSLAIEFLSTLTSTAKRIQKEHDLN